MKLAYNLELNFAFYWIFKEKGIHKIKIIFRKKLYDCSFLFWGCKDIIEIDLSNFDCSQVTSCESMFQECSSLKKLNLGNIDFGLSRNFISMFSKCRNLEELDVSHFNTKNSLNFRFMFSGCLKLKIIDVSKFNSLKCTNIDDMFSRCESLSEIDMINWDMSSLKVQKFGYKFSCGLQGLFEGCLNLKKIKMNSNFSDDVKRMINEDDEIFKELPEGGKFYWRKGITCNELLNQLPVSWNREQE